jgi:hypothetical protein
MTTKHAFYTSLDQAGKALHVAQTVVNDTTVTPENQLSYALATAAIGIGHGLLALVNGKAVELENSPPEC